MNTTTTTLSMGEKIKQLRMAKGLSQENLAQAIDKSTAFISRLERDDAVLDSNLLVAIKQYLGAENAPLQEHELELYKSRIWAWNDMVHNRRMEEAKAMKDELSAIQDLPFERELNVLYLMVATRIAVVGWNIPVVEENLNAVEDYMAEASPDVLYLYHRNMGTLKYTKADFKGCLHHHQQALEYNDNKSRPDVQLVFSVGECFLQIGKPIVALPYLERAKREFSGDRTHQLTYALDITLAGCYMLFGDYEKAKKMYEELHSLVKSFKVDAMTGNVLVCYGALLFRMGDTHNGLKYTDEALPYLKEVESYYLRALINKASILAELKIYDKCEEALSEIKELAKDDKDVAIEIGTVRCQMNLKDAESLNYLESVSLPFYRSRGGAFISTSLHLCKTLETIYRKKRAAKKADTIAVIMRDIYEDMIFWPNKI